MTILGTRGEIEASAPYHARHSGILIDDTLLFDLGEKEFLDYNPSYIFITHLHPDHAYFVRSGTSIPETNAIIYAPENYSASTKKGKQKTTPDHQETVVKIFPGKLRWHGYTISAIPTEHSLKVKSQAYLIEKNGKRVLYTGDLFWIDKKYHNRLGNLDLVITEGSYLKKGGMIRRSKLPTDDEAKSQLSQPFGHTGIPNLLQLFAPHTKQIALMHFGTWFYTDGARKAHAELKNLGKQYGIEVIAGYDGLQIQVS